MLIYIFHIIFHRPLSAIGIAIIHIFWGNVNVHFKEVNITKTLFIRLERRRVPREQSGPKRTRLVDLTKAFVLLFMSNT